MPNELLISKKDLYGDLLINSAPHKYDERFKFTGKERDWETGYDFFGARYYFHLAGIWTGVDPLAHKYPWVTPYIYCGGNPIKYIDPDGRQIGMKGEDGEVYIYHEQDNQTGFYHNGVRLNSDYANAVTNSIFIIFSPFSPNL